MDTTKTCRNPGPRRALSLLVAFACPATQAAQFEFSNGGSLGWDTYVNYAAQWRTQSPADNLTTGDPLVAGSPTDPVNLAITQANTIKLNGNDGNRNFEAGEMIANRVSVITELDYKNSYGDVDWGAFGRAKAFYDRVYKDWKNYVEQDDCDYFYNTGAAVNAANTGDPDNCSEFHPATRNALGSDAYFLDAFVYVNFPFAGDTASVRIGQQVINWGEALLFPGLSLEMNPTDVTATHVPGFEAKDAFLPSDAINIKLPVTDALSLEAYYQWEWKPNRMDPAGSYWSVNEGVGPGKELFYVPAGGPDPSSPLTFALRSLDDVEPEDDDSHGVALRYLSEGGTEVGVYHVQTQGRIDWYNLKYSGLDVGEKPASSLAVPEAFFTRYFDDLSIYAVSVNTPLGDWNLAMEYSFAENAPQYSSYNGWVERTPISQWNIGVLQVFGPNPICDAINFLAEAVTVRTNGWRGRDLQFDAHSTGIGFKVDFQYLGVLPGIDIIIPTAGQYIIDGNMPAHLLMLEDGKQFAAGVRVVYLERLEAELNYATYFGNSEKNWIHDRDNVSLQLKYSL